MPWEPRLCEDAFVYCAVRSYNLADEDTGRLKPVAFERRLKQDGSWEAGPSVIVSDTVPTTLEDVTSLVPRLKKPKGLQRLSTDGVRSLGLSIMIDSERNPHHASIIGIPLRTGTDRNADAKLDRLLSALSDLCEPVIAVVFPKE